MAELPSERVSVGDVCIGIVDDDNQLSCVDERGAPLGAVAQAGSRFLYRYDFGDDWEHDVTVEKVTAGGAEGIVCTGGARACPPEDSGGPIGYAHLLEILGNPAAEEYRDTREWVGRKFDPERFDAAAANKRLATLSKRRRR
jgi:hypothetical protein